MARGEEFEEFEEFKEFELPGNLEEANSLPASMG
jgi:hypothetical protein